jgi:hypothetical protein
MNRRELMVGAGALALAGCGPATAVDGDVAVVAAGGDVFSGSRLMADVETYVGFGTHRTGSAGDLATSDWFASHWRGLGYEIEQTGVEAPNADTTVARLTAGGAAFDGFAQPPLSFTPDAGVTGKLVRWNAASASDVSGRIAYVHVERPVGAVSPGAAYRQAFQACAAAGAVGVVAAMSGPSGEVVAINTPLGMTLNIPVLQLGEKLKPQLDGIADAGGDVTLTITGPGGTRKGKNTVARYGAEGPWVIISTPQSGWFTCGGERGPGIAMSRALSAWAMEQKLPVRWLFIATSGHEWQDAGAHIFHKSQAPHPDETALWFHLGASFGARAHLETPDGLVAQETPNLVRTLMATPDLIPLAEAAFAGQPVIETPMPADVTKALGEFHLVLEEGYPSGAGFWGGNAHFHTPIDGADSTTAAIMEPIARAVAEVIAAKLKSI